MRPGLKPDPKKPAACSVCGGHGVVKHGGVTKKCNACDGKGKDIR